MKPLDTPEIVGQLAHVGWGALICFTLGLLWLPLWAAALVTVIIAFSKEFMEFKDWAIWEPRASWQDSSIDFSFFLVGIAYAVYILRIAHR